MDWASLIPLGVKVFSLAEKLIDLYKSDPEAAKKSLASLRASLDEHLASLQATLAANDAAVDAEVTASAPVQP